MKTEQLLAYYQAQRVAILDNIAPAKELDDEAIHQLRVAIKKLRAYSVFLSDLSDGAFQLMGQLTSLNELFKRAGKIRDAQVQLQLLQRYEVRLGKDFPNFENFLQATIRKHEPLFKTHLLALDETVFAEKSEYFEQQIGAIDLREVGPKLEEIVQAKLNMLGELKHHNGNEERLHDFRKLFKELMYTFRFGKDFEAGFVPTFPHKSMDAFAERLGNWHDQTVMITFLRKYRGKAKADGKAKVLLKRVSQDSLWFMENFEGLLVCEKLVV